MSFFSKFFGAFASKPPSGSDRYILVYVVSHRCNESIAGQFDLMNEISLADEGDGYYARKVLHTSGKDRCFGQVEVEIWLDKNKRVTRHEVQGGRWLSAEEYAAEVARQGEEQAGESEHG